MHTSGSQQARPFHAIGVSRKPAVLQRILPAVESALAGGPAILPVPEHQAVRDSLLAAMRPSEPLETVSDDVVALVVPTSGSTGKPKGVLLGAAALTASAEAAHARLGGPGRWLLALPATHIAGLMVLVRSVLAGTDPVAIDLTKGFDPAAFAAVTKRHLAVESASRHYTALVPRQLAAVLDHGGEAVEALATFDAVLVGGSALPQDLLDRARAQEARVVTTYGMTETSGGCVYDGVPLDGVRVAATAGGWIKVAGPVLCLGYRLRPDLTAQRLVDGWLTTDDVGQVGPDGRLDVSGRGDDVAVSGGVNVPLDAVDSLVARHSKVAAAAAVAVPDPSWGQRVVAILVPRDWADPPTLDSIRAFVSQQAPAAYAPKELVLVETLPTLPGGKVDRPTLAAWLSVTTTA